MEATYLLELCFKKNTLPLYKKCSYIQFIVVVMCQLFHSCDITLFDGMGRQKLATEESEKRNDDFYIKTTQFDGQLTCNRTAHLFLLNEMLIVFKTKWLRAEGVLNYVSKRERERERGRFSDSMQCGATQQLLLCFGFVFILQ